MKLLLIMLLSLTLNADYKCNTAKKELIDYSYYLIESEYKGDKEQQMFNSARVIDKIKEMVIKCQFTSYTRTTWIKRHNFLKAEHVKKFQ